MSIFLNADSKVIVQGMTGSEGMKHTARMLASGTNVVGGVNPKKAGQTVDFDVNGETKQVPVFGSVKDAMAETGANVSVIFVPPPFAKSAAVEAIEAEMPLAVVITEGIPVRDSAEFYNLSKGSKTRLLGPNCPGIISPGESNAGIIPANIAGKGRIGLVSKSGTLTYQMMYELRDFGFSTAIGIGGDPVIGTTHIDALEAFQNDPDTDAIVMIGEIGHRLHPCVWDADDSTPQAALADDGHRRRARPRLAPRRQRIEQPRSRTGSGEQRRGG